MFTLRVVVVVRHGTEATNRRVIVVGLLPNRLVAFPRRPRRTLKCPVNTAGHNVRVAAGEHSIGAHHNGMFTWGMCALVQEELLETRQS